MNFPISIQPPRVQERAQKRHKKVKPATEELFLLPLFTGLWLLSILPFLSLSPLSLVFLVFHPSVHTLPFAAFSEMPNICTRRTQACNNGHVCRHACKHGQCTRTHAHTACSLLPESGVRPLKWERARGPEAELDMNTQRGSAWRV